MVVTWFDLLRKKIEEWNKKAFQEISKEVKEWIKEKTPEDTGDLISSLTLTQTWDLSAEVEFKDNDYSNYVEYWVWSAVYTYNTNNWTYIWNWAAMVRRTVDEFESTKKVKEIENKIKDYYN